MSREKAVEALEAWLTQAGISPSYAGEIVDVIEEAVMDDRPLDDDEEPDPNLEGQPEFNGAFR